MGFHPLDRARNAAILAVQMIATGDSALRTKLLAFKDDLGKKVVKANEKLKDVSFKFKTN
jgi:5-(carboxyamino)imidazole ribonucleotide mutase